MQLFERYQIKNLNANNSYLDYHLNLNKLLYRPQILITEAISHF